MKTEPALTFRMKRAPGGGERDGMPSWVRELTLSAALQHGFALDTLISGDRRAKVVIARDQAVFEIKSLKPSLSWKRIALWFGRDHATIMASYARHARRAEEGA